MINMGFRTVQQSRPARLNPAGRGEAAVGHGWQGTGQALPTPTLPPVPDTPFARPRREEDLEERARTDAGYGPGHVTGRGLHQSFRRLLQAWP